MGVDETPVAEVVVAPHPRQQHVAGHHLPGVLGQVDQQEVLRLGEVDRLAAAQHQTFGRPDLDVAVVERRRLGPRVQGAAQDGPHPCQQLAGHERFRDVVVGTELERRHHVVRVDLGGHHDDRHRVRRSDHAHEIETAEAGKLEIDEQQVGPVDLDPFERVFRIARLEDPVVLVLQQEPQHRAHIGVVFDEENAGRHGAILSSPGVLRTPARKHRTTTFAGHSGHVRESR